MCVNALELLANLYVCVCARVRACICIFMHNIYMCKTLYSCTHTSERVCVCVRARVKERERKSEPPESTL